MFQAAPDFVKEQFDKDKRFIGLTIMKERAKHLGGELDLESDPEEGTRIEVNFHYNDEPEIKLEAAIQQ